MFKDEDKITVKPAGQTDPYTSCNIKVDAEHIFKFWSKCGGGIKSVSKVPPSKAQERENVGEVLVFSARRETSS